MHNCSSERMQDLSCKSAQSLISTTIAFHPALVLLVEPYGSMQSPKILLGTDKRYCVIDINTIPEIVDLRDENISVAVLSVGLGQSVLKSAATSVRRQWPAAKILLQGCVGTDFDDHLYETAVDSSKDPVGFMLALDVIANQKVSAQTDEVQAGIATHETSEIPRPAKVGGLSREMSLIRSPHHGTWNKLMGVQRL